MDAEDRINTVTFITVLACDAKFGHGGGAIGILVGEALRIAFNVKRTDFDKDNSVDPARAGH